MNRISISLLTIALLVLGACSSNQPKQKSNLTYGTVKSKIVKGQTSQAEVVQLLGNPNIVTKNRSGDEVWTYSKQSTEAKSGSSGFFLGVIGGSQAFSSNSSATLDLIVTYDKNDIVKDYSVVQSQF